jgi:3-oxoacyl-[acyl-carrier-protein] synthase-3
MEGRTVILHAARKLPRTINELLERNGCQPASVETYLLHQANLNLITRVAQALRVPQDRFFCNLNRYGNTSSASLLIAAAEWWNTAAQRPGSSIVLAAFGAGFHWGAVLAYTC